jgi:hypothetical protein
MAQLLHTYEKEASRYLELEILDADTNNRRLRYFLTFSAFERGSVRYQIELLPETIRSLACACINIETFVDRKISLGGKPASDFIHNKEETHYYYIVVPSNRLKFTLMGKYIVFGKRKGQICVTLTARIATSNWNKSGLVGQHDSYYVMTTTEACRAFGHALLDEMTGSAIRP